MPSTLSTIPAIGVTALLAFTLIADVRNDIRRFVSGRSVVLLGIFSWFLFEALTLSAEVRQYNQGQYNFGIFCVVISIGAFLAGYHLTKGCGFFEPIAAKVCVLDNPRALWRLVVICAIIGFARILFYSGLQLIDLLHGILGMRQTWGGLIGRGRYGGFREAMLQLENLVTGVAPFAVILLLDRRSSAIQRILCGIVAVWPVLRGLGSGTRSSFLMAVLPILAIIYFRSSPDHSAADDRRRALRHAAGLCLDGRNRRIPWFRRVLLGIPPESDLRGQ